MRFSYTIIAILGVANALVRSPPPTLVATL